MNPKKDPSGNDNQNIGKTPSLRPWHHVFSLYRLNVAHAVHKKFLEYYHQLTEHKERKTSNDCDTEAGDMYLCKSLCRDNEVSTRRNSNVR